MCLRVSIALTATLVLTAALGCARRQEVPEAAPAVAPSPDTSESAPPVDTEAVPSDVEGQGLFETKCTQCHTLDRVGKHDPAEEPWPEVVEEMQGKKADWISDEDADAIVEYLEETYSAP